MEDIASRPVGWGNMRVKERIAYAVKTRLLMNAPYIGVPPIVCVMHPQYVVLTAPSSSVAGVLVVSRYSP